METRVALLTPPGRSALATLALVGPLAWEVVRPLFQPLRGALPEQPEPGRFWLGRFGEEVRDEVVLAALADDPVPRVEIHCHGGPEVTRMLVELLAARGVRPCSWEELPSREGGSIHRAALVCLARALTVRTAAILLDQAAGALDRAIEEILAALTAGDLSRGELLLGELLQRASLGLHLTSPWRLVIAGAPNVGKSSLLNSLAGYQRSIIAPTPGTTRDLVAVQLAVDGWPVEVIDTAGLRQGGETLEEMGIEQARAAAANADLVLWLVDAVAAPVWPEQIGDNLKVIVNKADLPPAWDQQAAEALRISATTGQGIDELLASISRWLVPTPPPSGTAVPFLQEQVERFRSAQTNLRAGDHSRAIDVLGGLRSV
jgi:tRNA modification GTPase